MNTTTQKTSTISLDPFQKSVHTTHSIDPQIELDPFWDEDLPYQGKLEYKDTSNKPKDQIESVDLITDANVLDAIRFAMINFRTMDPHLPDTSSIPCFQPRPENQHRQIAVLDGQYLPQL